MSRDNTVRVSTRELDALKRVRDDCFGRDTALGEVISNLATEKTGEVAEQKEIIITGQGTQIQYGENDIIGGPRVRLISRPVGENGNEIRGFNPDLIVLLTPLSEDIMSEVIRPMLKTGSELVKLY